MQVVRDVFGDRTEEVLKNLKVGFVSNRYMYMGVSDEDGNLRVGTYHLRNSDLRTLYLDVVHELFHVRQFEEDREWFGREHRKYLKGGFNPKLYFSSPLEVPAYRHAVNEAKRIGMSYEEIAEYLKMGPVEPAVFSKLLRDVGVEKNMGSLPTKKPNVKINRDAKVPLFPFTDYFKGFDRVAAVKELFGQRTGQVLDGLAVEFTGTPMGMIFPNEEDGHLVVGTPYFMSGDSRLLYTDVVMCLNMVKQASERKASGPESESEQETLLIEACGAAAKEARRVGLSDSELRDHLNTPRFMMTPRGFRRLLVAAGVGESGD